MTYYSFLKNFLILLVLGCYLISILSISELIPFDNLYQYFFYAGSVFLLVYNFLYFQIFQKLWPAKNED